MRIYSYSNGVCIVICLLSYHICKPSYCDVIIKSNHGLVNPIVLQVTCKKKQSCNAPNDAGYAQDFFNYHVVEEFGCKSYDKAIYALCKSTANCL